MATYQITEEEKALLDAAKKVCKQWGFSHGELLTHRDERNEAEAALIAQLQCGVAVVDGQYVRDLASYVRKGLVMIYTETQYAPCPFCKEEFGMGLGLDPAKRCQVVCLCGARGPIVNNDDFRGEDGNLDIDRRDGAARTAWNKSCSILSA
jgi:hypothetical protein